MKATGFLAGVLLMGASVYAAGTIVPRPAVPGEGAAPPITWVTIPAGTFQMGCVPADRQCNTDEQPRHAVTISRDFQLMETEVTAGVYRALMGELDEQPPWSTTPDHPAVIVTWDEAEAFCEKAGGRLPTEAEWEYAARGGREGAIYPWGDETPADKPGAPNGAALESDRPRPVKSYTANGYGLFDIAGNVWEWTADVGTLYRDEARIDPLGAAAGSTRIVRGGSFGDDPGNLRVSNRTPNRPDRVNVNVGFRCARLLPIV
jgi:formylglycine-generating enzyme required for sulfatase activity